MKRILSNQNKDKKAELRKLVLIQLSKMRTKMKREHPGMLEGLREKMEASQQNQASQPFKPTPPETAQAKPDLAIDHVKNKETIEKMLNLKSDNPGFEKAVKAILSKQKH
ncbi:MAG: hypothetical protein GW778_07235 [Alphaproteobacteria bacterium]|nr:hypothetical protein [Alphaproteobacteria bacterium]